MSAHPSGRKMYERMRQQVYWRGMAEDAMRFSKTCGRCQRNRFGIREKPEYQERGMPTRPMQRTSIDILSLEGVRAPGPHDILVIVDEFTRYAEAYPIANKDADTCADKMVEEWICRFGIPEQMLSDRGAQFLGDLFKALCRQLRIEKVKTTSYHPQCNGANERMHGTLYTILRALVNKNGKNWRKQLPLALFVYRNAVHKSIGISPHQALFGYMSRHECLDEYDDPKELPVERHVQALHEMREHLQARMEQVEKENRLRHNVKRNLRHYEVGDKVLLRNHVRHKLEAPWKGPYTIIQRIGNVNYELELPEGDRTHKIIHLQNLKPWFTPWDAGGLPTITESESTHVPAMGRVADPKIVYEEERELRPENSHIPRPMTRAWSKHMLIDAFGEPS